MKNRTIIGIACILLALVVSFVVAPLVNKLGDSRADIVRVKRDITQGHKITDDDIEVVSVGDYNLPTDVLTNKKEVVGKYATCDIKKGDYLLPAKLSLTSDSASDVFMSLDGSQVAISITIPSFAGGLSGKLKNGDVVSLIVYSNQNSSVIPKALKYVRVITATTADGLDKDELIQNEDGTYELPTTLTLLVDPLQAKLLTEYENNSIIHAVLVTRGNEKLARQYLKEQADILTDLTETEVSEDG